MKRPVRLRGGEVAQRDGWIQFQRSVAQVLLWQQEPSHQAAMLRHLIFRLLLVFYFSVLIHTLSLSLFPFPRQQVTPEFVYLSFCVYSEVYVDSSSCVGGRGGGSLHPSGEAADPAALQACGESRQERFPVPQEALPQRNPVSTTHSAELLLLSLMVFLILISRL